MGKSAFSSPYFPTPGSRWHTSRPKTSRKVSTIGASSRATRQICRIRRSTVALPFAPSPPWGEGNSMTLVPVGNRQLVGREERDDLGAFRRYDHFLLDARGRDAIRSRAVGLDGEDHARLQLHGMIERVDP